MTTEEARLAQENQELRADLLYARRQVDQLESKVERLEDALERKSQKSSKQKYQRRNNDWDE